MGTNFRMSVPLGVGGWKVGRKVGDEVGWEVDRTHSIVHYYSIARN